MPPKIVPLSLSDALAFVSENLSKLLSSLNQHKQTEELLALCECPAVRLIKREKDSLNYVLFQFHCSILDLCSKGLQSKEITAGPQINQKLIRALSLAEDLAKITKKETQTLLASQGTCILQGIAYLVFINALVDDFFNLKARLSSSVDWICSHPSTQQIVDHSKTTNYISVKNTLDYLLERTEDNRNHERLKDNPSGSKNPLTHIRLALQKTLTPEDLKALLCFLAKPLQFEEGLFEALFDWIKGDLEESLIANFDSFKEMTALHAFLSSISSLKVQNYFSNSGSLSPQLNHNPSAQLFESIYSLDSSYSLLKKNALLIDNPNYSLNRKRLKLIRIMATFFDSKTFYDLFPAPMTKQFALRCKETIYTYRLEMNDELGLFILRILDDIWKKDELIGESDVRFYAKALGPIIENNSWSQLNPDDQSLFFTYTANLFANPILKTLDVKNSAQTDLLINQLICKEMLKEAALLLTARCQYNNELLDTQWHKESCYLLFIITLLKEMPKKIPQLNTPLEELAAVYKNFFTELSGFYQMSFTPRPFSDYFTKDNCQFLKEPMKSILAAILATKIDFIKFQLYVLEFLALYDPDRKVDMDAVILKNFIIHLAIILKDQEFGALVQKLLEHPVKPPQKILDLVPPPKAVFKKSELITQTQLHFASMLKALNQNENQVIVPLENCDFDIWLLMACQRFRIRNEQQEEWSIAQNELLAQFNASVIQLISVGYSNLNFKDFAKIFKKIKEEGKPGSMNSVRGLKITASQKDKPSTRLQHQSKGPQVLNNLGEAKSVAFFLDPKEYSENKSFNQSGQPLQDLEIKLDPTQPAVSLSSKNRDQALALLTRIEKDTSLMDFFLDNEGPFSYHLLIYSLFHEIHWIFPKELIELMKKMATREKASLGEQSVLSFLIGEYRDVQPEQKPNEARIPPLVKPLNQAKQALPESLFTKAARLILSYHRAEIGLADLDCLKLDVTSPTFEALKTCDGVPKALANYVKLSLAHKLMLPFLKKSQFDFSALEPLIKLLSENHYFPYVANDKTACYLFSFFEHCHRLARRLKVDYSFDFADTKTAQQHFMPLDEAILLFKSLTIMVFNPIELTSLTKEQQEKLLKHHFLY